MSLPYSHIQAYSVETAGHFDLDSELEMWFSGLDTVNDRNGCRRCLGGS